MTQERDPDPVDLMLDGRFEDAARAYLKLYVDALRRQDFAIGPDLLMGLHYCLAGVRRLEPIAPDVDVAVKEELVRHDLKMDKRVRDQLQTARSMVNKARKRAERSVAWVESEKDRRWKGSEDFTVE